MTEEMERRTEQMRQQVLDAAVRSVGYNLALHGGGTVAASLLLSVDGHGIHPVSSLVRAEFRRIMAARTFA
jgi:hypothetical protein